MTDAGYKKYLDAAEKSPKEIAAAVSGLSDRVLRYKPSPEKWCVLEILGHLADVEIIYGYRLRQMLADSKPVIAPLDQDAWARNLNYLDSPPSELVAFYGLARHHNLRLLRSLKDSDFSKSAFHPEMQRETTVAELVERMGGHGAAHLQQIERLKAAASKLSA
jgi:DinB superfamily